VSVLLSEGGEIKKLADMNLVDDFLAYSLTTHKRYGEEASRFILECILQRKIGHLTIVPQKVWHGEEPKGHGVRLDVYLDEEDGEIFDMEPDNNGGADSVAALPRRVRFYHAKIDAGNLTAGDDYSTLRNVVVIFIATYDPFGRKRMVYTIKNRCVEEPDLPYEDGAWTIFLYTKGTKGEPAEELKQLARYMEHSTAENAQSAGLARLHEMVAKVKSDREVGLAYMKACEIEKRIRTEGKAEDILLLLAAKGEVEPRLERVITAQTDTEKLNQWLLLAAGSASVEEFQAKL
jgi:predicted transposase/invertase (TIGR01784 family)